MLSKHQVQLRQYRANYYETGAGPTILFLHGFLGNGLNWQEVIGHLQGNFRCIALDLLGFGESSKPELKYNIWHQVDFLKDFIAHLNLQDFALVGHSFGGWTTAAFGIGGESDQLRRIALIAPAGIRDDQFVGRYKHLRPLLWKTPLVDLGLSAMKPLASVFGQTESLQFAQTARQNFKEQPVAASFLRDRLRPEDAIDTVEKDLHLIQVPTAIFAGRQDEVIPFWHCKTYHQGISESEFFVYEDGAHDLLQTHPEAIAQTLLERWAA